MSKNETQNLCLALMRADNEGEVITLLADAGYWNKESAWRLYGDNDNNFSIIGAQQSSPDAALVEKFVNSIDHRLINECLIRGLDPEGPEAPQSIRVAVAKFFENDSNPDSNAGRVATWLDKNR